MIDNRIKQASRCRGEGDQGETGIHRQTEWAEERQVRG